MFPLIVELSKCIVETSIIEQDNLLRLINTVNKNTVCSATANVFVCFYVFVSNCVRPLAVKVYCFIILKREVIESMSQN